MSQNFFEPPLCRCHYCGTQYQPRAGHDCPQAERVMQAKRAAEAARITGSTRNARRLADKAARKEKR